jgi:hypothetical protein
LNKGARVLLAVLVPFLGLGAAACDQSSDSGAKASVGSTASTAPASSPTSATVPSGPVTDADVAEVDQIVHRLDSELDRLDSDMATNEGEVQ